MSDESFYGVTLTGQDSTVSWDVLSNDEDFPRGQKLIIKQILLGAEAKEGEFNVVEVCFYINHLSVVHYQTCVILVNTMGLAY
ncbi:nucleoplasmin-like protein [Teleopsis dalmanni]|uniref:nucleoplasmin-like protein n=1 Tax=Teleopsis dalmanni TaxID=139649 RepID=UPI0018CCA926|nr:nucleoplasmin-like protein [Teleopsis dalmanni]